MNFLDKAKLLLQFGFRPIRGETHAERLESFYGYQADQYDAYREAFLIGRRELMRRLRFEKSTHWLDIGCGTGYLLDCAPDEARDCARIVLVDAAPSLLEVARRRVRDNNWNNVEIIQADAAQLRLEGTVDIVTFSYSLTMIPDWFTAVDLAHRMLRPGGTIAVTDFFVSEKHARDSAQHSWLTRTFWPAWFDGDNVYPNRDHLPYLRHRFQMHWLSQGRTRIPGLALMRPPCYQFLGTKRN